MNASNTSFAKLLFSDVSAPSSISYAANRQLASISFLSQMDSSGQSTSSYSNIVSCGQGIFL